MRIGVLGTGMVGQALATKLVQCGHEVTMGSRQPANPKAEKWAGEAGENARAGTFTGAAEFGEVVVNATAGNVSLGALQMAGYHNLTGKVLIDVANPLTFDGGHPSLSVCNNNSLAEQIQRAYPDVKVVKTLNTVNASIMVEPALVPGDHNVFVAGNDNDAKTLVVGLLKDFGWPETNILDLGDVTAARGMEGYLLLWLRMYQSLHTATFNVAVTKPSNQPPIGPAPGPGDGATSD